MAVMAVPFLFLPRSNRKKRNNDINTLRTDIAASLDSLIGLTVAT